MDAIKWTRTNLFKVIVGTAVLISSLSILYYFGYSLPNHNKDELAIEERQKIKENEQSKISDRNETKTLIQIEKCKYYLTNSMEGDMEYAVEGVELVRNSLPNSNLTDDNIREIVNNSMESKKQQRYQDCIDNIGSETSNLDNLFNFDADRGN